MKPSEARRRFRAAVRREARRRGVQINLAALNVGSTLADLQQQIRELLRHQPSDFDQYRLSELLEQVDRHIAQWERRAIDVAAEGMDNAWAMAPNIVDGPLRAVGADIGGLLLPDAVVEQMKSQIRVGLLDLTPTVQTRIHDSIRMAVLGGQSPHEVMVTIGDTVRKPGPFKFVHFRAEVLTRTEVGRLHSMAGDRRMRQAGTIVAGLKKQWLWSGKSRLTHMAVDGQVRELDEKFLVAGEYLSFPRDPDASPENTIQCGCESVPYKDDWS